MFTINDSKNIDRGRAGELIRFSLFGAPTENYLSDLPNSATEKAKSWA